MEQIDPARSGHVIIGVDTHKYIHVAAVMDPSEGFSRPSQSRPTRPGSGSYWSGRAGSGRSLRSVSRAPALTVLDSRRSSAVTGTRSSKSRCPDRRLRRLNGKSDTLDAENAARAVLAGFATAVPKTADGVVEMIRQLKVAHDTGSSRFVVNDPAVAGIHATVLAALVSRIRVR